MNIPTIITALIIAVIFFAIVKGEVRKRKNGASCGCGCPDCVNKDGCRKN